MTKYSAINDTKMLSSENFDYKFFGNFSSQQINDFLQTQEADLQKILIFLHAKKPKTRFLYKIFLTLIEKQKADPYHSISRACARAEEKTIYRVLGPQMEMLSFPHEIVHLIAHEMSPHYKWNVVLDSYNGNERLSKIEFSSTSFLQEGLALLIDELVFGNKLREAGEYKFLDDWVKYNQDKTTIKPHEIFEFYKFCEQSPIVATPICGSFCKFLVEKYGLKKFMHLYKRSSELNTEAININILEKIYKNNMAFLEDEWQRTVLS